MTETKANKVPLTDNAREVFMRRYALKNDEGEVVEVPEDTMKRVARQVAARGRAVMSGRGADLELKFAKMLTSLDFLPNSPTFTGAGTGLGQLAACFVLPIEDDMGGHPDGIFATLRNAALIQQTGGGNGFSFSRLRPAGSLVKTSKGKATGPLGFLKVYDAAFGEIAQGGTRRGANMGVMRIDHPDVLDFIMIKQTEGEIENFNLSVALTDEFMSAVVSDDVWALTWEDEVYACMNAVDLFDFICALAWHNGEPGALFIDTANDSNPLPHLYDLEATNPCGEQWLGPYENCCLGSINLANHLTLVSSSTRGDEWVIDWDKLRKTTYLATEFLDCVVDANAYVKDVPQLREAALKARRIGLGIMGFADICYRLGIRYGSEWAEQLATNLMEFIRFHSMWKSCELAKELGAFPEWKRSTYKDGIPWMTKMRLAALNTSNPWDRPELDWYALDKSIAMVGLRNAAQTTIAPTGTISTVAGVEGYGCEPVFALGYTRHVKEAEGDVDLEYLSPIFEETINRLRDEGRITQGEYEDLRTDAAQYGSIKHVDPMAYYSTVTIQQLKQVFVTASDITAGQHVAMQAAFQTWVDNSLSKTINMSPEATVNDVKDAYMMAWDENCKGITVYVEGSRQQVVLETKAEQERKSTSSNQSTDIDEDILDAMRVYSTTKNEYVTVQEAANDKSNPHVFWDGEKYVIRGNMVMSEYATTWPAEKESPAKQELKKLKRPQILNGATVRRETPSGTAYVTINENEEGPVEVFVTVGKAGSEISAISEAMGRLISLYLRSNGTVDRAEKLAMVMGELQSIGGSLAIGFGKNRVRSLPDGIAQAIADYVQHAWTENKAESEVSDPAYTLEEPQNHVTAHSKDVCPECGDTSLAFIEGCQTCLNCSYSRCG